MARPPPAQGQGRLTPFTDVCVAPGRISPAPKGSDGGIDMGKRPLMALIPRSAWAAARCESGKPPHATMYVEISGTC